MAYQTYAQKLRDPRWFAKRQEVIERDDHTCRYCEGRGDDADYPLELQVHHVRYRKVKEPWEYENSDLLTLCNICHGNLTDDIEQITDLLCDLQRAQPWRLQYAKAMLKRLLYKAQTAAQPEGHRIARAALFGEE